ncbi:MAG: HEPN domain-containing protein [Armatimonadota bacterium]|nr:HEPN domain-containing protein [Armatimonadota bacterium]
MALEEAANRALGTEAEGMRRSSPGSESAYRLNLAEGFLNEARQDLGIARWRSCVDNSQLAVENAGKAVLALLGPLGRTHNPAVLLRKALEEGRFPAEVRARVERITECARLLGPDIHAQSDYGDEAAWKTPWELFSEADAKQALALADEAVHLAREVVGGSGSG